MTDRPQFDQATWPEFGHHEFRCPCITAAVDAGFALVIDDVPCCEFCCQPVTVVESTQ